MASPTGPHGSPLGNNNNNREGTRVILREITATLQNSPPLITPTKNKTGIDVTRTPEHEIKVKFAREFIEITEDSSTKSHTQTHDSNSLSSASSFQSLTSTLSTKSSSGICADSPIRSSDISYANSDIPGLDDLLSACAGIRLEDSYADASFASATDESNNNLTQNLPEYTKTVDDIQKDLNKTQEIVKSNFNQTQDIIVQSDNQTTEDLTVANNITLDVENKEKFNKTNDSLSPENTKTSESLSQTLTDNQTDSLTLDTTIDVIQPLTTSSENCLLSDSEKAFSSSADENKLINTETNNFTDELQTQNNIESQTCDSVVNETINGELPEYTDICYLSQTYDSVINETSYVDSSENTNIYNLSQTYNSVVNETIHVETSEFTNINNLSQTCNSVVNETTHVETPENTDICNLSQTCNSVVNETTHANLSKNTDICNLSQTCNSVVNETTHVETPENTNICNLSFIKSVESPQVIEPKVNESNVILKVVEETEVDTASVALNQTIELSKPLLVEEHFVDHDNLISSEVKESNQEPVGITNFSNNSGESNKILTEELKVKNFEALATERLSDDFVSIKTEKNSSFSIDNNQSVISQLQNKSFTHDETFESAADDTIKTDYIKETLSGTFVNSNNTLVVKTEDSDETSSVNADNQVIFEEKNTKLIESNCDFNQLKSEAQRLADNLYNTSLEFTDDNEEEFVPASSELFPDLMSVDLSNFNSGTTTKQINNRLRSESLYVKFDPLVSNSTMLPQGNIASPPTNDGRNGDKDTCVSEIGSPKRNPAIAAIDRLLFYSPLPAGTIKKDEEPEKIEPREKTPEPTPVIDSVVVKELELVRSTVLQLEEQLERQKINYENDIKKLQDDKDKTESQNETLRDTVNQLKKELSQEIKSKSQITVVVDEYEKSISRLVAEKERGKNNYDAEKSQLYEELQDAKNHLAATEAAFNDVHAKYEKLKIIVTESRNNEQVLKESINENVEIIKSLEHRYEQIKNHAAARLEKANHDLDTIRKQHESENVKLRAMLRKEELKSNSLAELVEQKSKENKELTQILDEVIARVGPKSDD